MKKKIFGSIAVLVIAAMTAFNVNINSNDNGLSDVSLANVEALAFEYDYGFGAGFARCDYSTSTYCFEVQYSNGIIDLYYGTLVGVFIYT